MKRILYRLALLTAVYFGVRKHIKALKKFILEPGGFEMNTYKKKG